MHFMRANGFNSLNALEQAYANNRYVGAESYSNHAATAVFQFTRSRDAPGLDNIILLYATCSIANLQALAVSARPIGGQTCVELNYPLYGWPCLFHYWTLGTSAQTAMGRTDVRRHEENADHVLNWSDGQNGKLPSGTAQRTRTRINLSAKQRRSAN